MKVCAFGQDNHTNARHTAAALMGGSGAVGRVGEAKYALLATARPRLVVRPVIAVGGLSAILVEC